MTDPSRTRRLASLSAKEKETLRLLAHGHDAKSLARHLGLSVHTVNERLRDARRKLAVSSSREAARQLRDAEGTTPDSLGDEDLGDAPCRDAMPAPARQTDGAGHPRRRDWLIGGTAMSAALALLALAAFSVDNPPAPSPAVQTASAAESAATNAARQWLALVDAGDWQGSWQATGAQFRALNSVDMWTQASQRVRVPLGAMRSRELVQADFAPAPPQGYWVLKFRTGYAGKASVIETVSLAAEDGGWKVVGFTIG